jgi:2-oxoglutarate dehydrogenase E1 component
MDSLNANQTLHYAGRPASASPAVGYASVHLQEQQELVIQALTKTF